MPYSYRQRPIGSCRARQPVRGAETALNIANARALYLRPKMIHAGPTPQRQGESEEIPFAWPWVRLGGPAGGPEYLERASAVWLQHPLGTLDVLLRVVGITFAKGIGDVRPTDHSTRAPVKLTTELCQYQDGSETPVVLASTVLNTTILCYPVTPLQTHAYHPLLKILSLGWRAVSTGGYLPNRQFAGSQRDSQFYPADLAILQSVRLELPYGDTGWAPSFDAVADKPCFLRVKCELDTGRPIIWDQSVVNSPGEPIRNFRDPEFIRIFNMASTVYDRGRL